MANCNATICSRALLFSWCHGAFVVQSASAPLPSQANSALRLLGLPNEANAVIPIVRSMRAEGLRRRAKPSAPLPNEANPTHKRTQSTAFAKRTQSVLLTKRTQFLGPRTKTSNRMPEKFKGNN